MKKAVIALAFALCLAVTGCSSRGDTRDTERKIYDTGNHTAEDIEAAMDVAAKSFRQTCNDCTLTELYYDGALVEQVEEERMAQYDAKEAIVLLSTFTTGSDQPGGGSFNLNDTYKDFSWVLIRSDGGNWTLATSGY